MTTSLISIPKSRAFPARARMAFDALNRFAAHPKYGASVEQIKAGVRARAARPKDEVDSRDLVAYLIQDNQDLWQQLLNTPFCKKMGEAAADDEQVLKGFKWYMVQDFLYCIKLMIFETDRSSRATTSAVFDISADRIAGDASYAKDLLQTCIQAQPEGLAIDEYKVLQASPTKAMSSYTDFQITTAQDASWVLALVAMIPCIQSYYKIAADLKDNSKHKDTIWYKLWVEENAKYEDSTVHQKQFFAENFDAWKDHYDEATRIFRRACQGEIDLWAVAENPGDV
ncbi:heme oxygenase-like protein [Wolfiporia cocos MD-104 SS10]|uniref:Heme oxygenase-like protein n=1 Tax=Wolfiporia cocos (strain MD-104) TaxID=742152 RepID=A0A2H3JJA5_WOLCO|nr:heme oxygenase-like protein [Wolfiporia cocos MD-104 SS10]